MYTILLVIHTILVLFLIGIILLQRSDDSGMGSLSGGGNNSVLSGRAAGNLLTRITAILATLFIMTSLALAIMSGHRGGVSITDQAPETSAPISPVPLPEGAQPGTPQPAAPEKTPAVAKSKPSVPKPE